jgi:hypothetical protein
LLVTTALACRPKKQPAVSVVKNDTTRVALDTVIPNTGWDPVKDSIHTKRQRDSFYAILPIKVFGTDEKGDAYKKMIAAMIDTGGISKTPLTFSDTSIYAYDKDQIPVKRRYIYRNKRFVVEVYDRNLYYGPKELYINGRKLKAGREIDTSLSGTFYIDNIDLNPHEFAIFKFGNKEYLYLSGNIEKCNGSGCGVSYYILYDPVIRKGMLLQQFRSEFIVGFDSKANTPVFLNMLEGPSGYNTMCDCFLYSASLYRFNRSGKIQAVKNNTGKQYYFDGYYKNESDSIFLIEGNLPDRNSTN